MSFVTKNDEEHERIRNGIDVSERNQALFLNINEPNSTIGLIYPFTKKIQSDTNAL